MKLQTMLLLLFGTFHLSCQKDLPNSSAYLEKEPVYVSLNQAIQMKEEKREMMRSSYKNELYASNSAPSFSVSGTGNPTECPAYPIMTPFSSSTKIYTTGDNSGKGGGRVMPYKFMKGKTYQVKFSASSINRYSHSSKMLNTFPGLQVGLANQSNFPNTCLNNLDFSNIEIPYVTIEKVPGENYYTGSTGGDSFTFYSRTITIIADECYDYIWLNVTPVSGDYDHEYNISNLTVTEVPGSFVLEQTGSLNNGETAVFKVKYNSFYIDHPFEWATTGNLLIQGEGTGSSVSVKASSSIYAGKVVASIPGCGVFAEEIFDNCTNGSNQKFINGGCETAMKVCSHSEKTGAYDEFGPLYKTYWVYLFSDGSQNSAGYTISNLMCNPH